MANALTDIQILMDKEDNPRDLEILESVHSYIQTGSKVPHDLIMQTHRIMNKGAQQNRYGK